MSDCSVYIRLSAKEVVPRSAESSLVVGDFEGGTLDQNIDSLLGVSGVPNPAARELFTLASAIYIADKTTSRKVTVDAWTRSFDVSMPVGDVQRWSGAKPVLEDALGFLTGDSWSLRFRKGPERALSSRHGNAPFGAVHLFSGGLDSLIGAVDVLARGDNILLVGHHDSSMTEAPQKTLAQGLSTEYDDQFAFVPIRVKANGRAKSFPLPASAENTTRSRSLVFLSMGLVAASALGTNVPLRVPENGMIALNVPLVPERSGSCSTRTTHPHFFECLSTALRLLGIQNPIENPYMLSTKGQMLSECANGALVRKIGPDSVSCSHSEQARWAGVSGFEKNCGYCFPCIIRRAAFNAIGEDRPKSQYRVDICRQRDFVKEPVRGKDLRAVLSAIGAPRERLTVLNSGPIPAGFTVKDLTALHRRGLNELLALFTDKGSRQVKAYAELVT
jgi:7-cyano-7-deazaguanine synthase in queuosine biosynthesis